jgi:hypothetical protein
MFAFSHAISTAQKIKALFKLSSISRNGFSVGFLQSTLILLRLCQARAHQSFPA